MLTFPFIESLDVSGYALYPGRKGKGGLKVQFTPGPWIVLGVNGLGKSTLLLLLKHVLTGARQSIAAGFRGEDRAETSLVNSRLFAMRVADGAEQARAIVSCRLGDSRVVVARKLSDLSLVQATFERDGKTQTIHDESAYSKLLAESMGVLRFEDALRVIDRILFTLETSEPLIWDVAAQYEIFRALLRPELSGDLRKLESTIVSADSTARNLNAALYKVTRRREEQITKQKSAGSIRAQLAATEAKLSLAQTNETRCQKELEEADQARVDARIELKRTERAVDLAAQAYESYKYQVLKQLFGKMKPNDQYVLLKLVAERICVACGQRAEEAAKEIENRHKKSLCPVCGNKRDLGGNVVGISKAIQEKAEGAYKVLERARHEKVITEERFLRAQERWDLATAMLEKSRILVDRLEANVRSLHKRLPVADRRQLTRQEDDIQALRREVTRFRAERDEAEEAISSLLGQLRSAAEALRVKIETSFQERARPFFADQVRLVYAPRADRIGQGGRVFEFPAFEIEMAPDGPHGNFVRRVSDQVSQSQREYLDAIFRMSLLETLGHTGCTVVIDGPEGSVDAVFAERAGNLFADFARDPSRNVILACNVVEGGLIPNALRAYPSRAQRLDRIVNLLDVGMPTTALKQLENEYQTKVSEILKQPSR